MRKSIFIALTVLISGMIYASWAFAGTYYVTTSGKATNSGSSSYPWSFLHACSTAVAGDTVYIKGGSYGHIHPKVIHSGSSGNPIVFIGYSGIPVLDGVNYYGYGIYIYNKDYVYLKNIRVKRYRYGVYYGSSDYGNLYKVIADSCVNTDSDSLWDGYGIYLSYCNNTTLSNSSATDCGGMGITLQRTNYCTATACSVRCKQSASSVYATDYYMVMGWGSNNTFTSCYVEDVPGSSKGNHGIGIKDTQSQTGTHSTGNQFINCTAKKLEECFVVAHKAHGNTFSGCVGNNTGKPTTSFNNVFMVRDSAYSNTFKNCTGTGCVGVVAIYDGSESGYAQTQDNNSFTNCSFIGGQISIYLRSARNTTFTNCTIVNSNDLFRFSKASSTGSDNNSGTVFKNCIISGVDSVYDTSYRTSGWGFLVGTTYTSVQGYSDMGNVSATYTCCYDGVAAFSGTGNFSSNPRFADTSYHLMSTVGHYTSSGWVADSYHSPCIDAGSGTYSSEPENNGNQINLGRWGNTSQASKSKRGYKVVAETPVEFGLLQNVPNPFNPSTTISYTVASEGMVTLKVYSANGQLVGTLVDEVKAPGSYRATWAPKGLASGMYFCKLQAGSFTKTNKMIFMK